MAAPTPRTCLSRSRRAPRRRGRAASRGCSRLRAPRRRAAQASARAAGELRRRASVESSSSASGSSACASKPAETSSSSGSKAPIARLGALERLEVALVAGAGGERQVEQRLALLVRPAGPGIERPLVQRDEEDRRVVADDRLRPVPVVDVPVEDRDPPEPELGLRPARGDRDRVEDAEAHRAVRLGVVPGRPREREAAAAAPPRSPRRRRGAPPRSVVSVQIVSASSQPGAERMRSTSAAVWQRRTSSSVAGRHSTNGNRSCSTSIRACDSGWPPVGCSRANAAWLTTLHVSARSAMRRASPFTPSSRAAPRRAPSRAASAASAAAAPPASIVAIRR